MYIETERRRECYKSVKYETDRDSDGWMRAGLTQNLTSETN